MSKVFIVAEAGSNILGYDYAKFCQTVAETGADAIKIQLFRAEQFPAAEQAEKRALEFPRGRLSEFAAAARAYGLAAGASVFDNESVGLAVLRLDFLKLAAREASNKELIVSCVRTGKPLYRSISSSDDYRQLYLDFRGMKRVVTLGTVQRYPLDMARALWAVFWWSLFFKTCGPDYEPVEWGWSSHTTGTLDCVMAARLGASVIEKHICLSQSDVESGHSLAPAQFAQMVKEIRNVH